MMSTVSPRNGEVTLYLGRMQLCRQCSSMAAEGNHNQALGKSYPKRSTETSDSQKRTKAWARRTVCNGLHTYLGSKTGGGGGYITCSSAGQQIISSALHSVVLESGGNPGKGITRQSRDGHSIERGKFEKIVG